jgi:hypothetical protein
MKYFDCHKIVKKGSKQIMITVNCQYRTQGCSTEPVLYYRCSTGWSISNSCTNTNIFRF